MSESSSLLMQGQPVGVPFKRRMARNRWVFVPFGLLAFLMPGLGPSVLLTAFAAWMLLDGVGSICQAAMQGGDALNLDAVPRSIEADTTGSR